MRIAEKIIIGQSDYTREQIVSGVSNTIWTLGNSPKIFIDTIERYEQNGYIVKFETSFFQRLFSMGYYRVIAYKYQIKHYNYENNY